MSYVSADFTVNIFGRPTEVNLEENIRQSIETAVVTYYQSLPFESSEGSLVEKYLRSPNDLATKVLIEFHAEQALSLLEQRININKITAVRLVEEQAVELYINYEIKRSALEQETVVTFFTSAINTPSNLPQTEDDLITQPPMIDNVSIAPNSLIEGSTGEVVVTITGQNFKTNSLVSISNPLLNTPNLQSISTNEIVYKYFYDTSFGSVGTNLINVQVSTNIGSSNVFPTTIDITQDVFSLASLTPDKILKPSLTVQITLLINDAIGVDLYSITNINGFLLNTYDVNTPSTGNLVFTITTDTFVNAISFRVNGGAGRFFDVVQVVNSPILFIDLVHPQVIFNGVVNEGVTPPSLTGDPNNQVIGRLAYELPLGQDGEISLEFNNYNSNAINLLFFMYEGVSPTNWLFGGEAGYSLNGVNDYVRLGEIANANNGRLGYEYLYALNVRTTLSVQGNTYKIINTSNVEVASFTRTRTAPIRVSIHTTAENLGGGTTPIGSFGQILFYDIFGGWQLI